MTVQSPKQFHSFLGGPGLCITDQDLGRDCLGDTNQPLKGPALSLLSLVQSSTPCQHIKIVQCPKQFYSPF